MVGGGWKSSRTAERRGVKIDERKYGNEREEETGDEECRGERGGEGRATRSGVGGTERKRELKEGDEK